MTRRVTFKTLWLVSERDRQARRLELSPTKTLLLGTNGTGKSRITKSVYWVLGCAPQKHPEAGWDPDAVGALEFTFNGAEYLAIRRGKRLGLLTGDGQVLFAEDNMSAWDHGISPFFGYHLELQRHEQGNSAQAGLEYLTLPFYIDQDGSWGVGWETYKNLKQFKNWRAPVFEAFAGLRRMLTFKRSSAGISPGTM